MTRTLPANASLENLKKQAKTLLRRWRDRDAESCSRIAASHPRLKADPAEPDANIDSLEPKLAECQLVIAREFGFPTWAQLRAKIEQRSLSIADLFLQAATLTYGEDPFRADMTSARQLLVDHRDIIESEIWTAAASGSVDAVRKLLKEDPSLANSKGGPYDFPPLIYLCYSRVTESASGLNGETNAVADAIASAKLLLENGADPNAYFLTHGTYHFSCITGAIGEGEGGPARFPAHPQARELVTLLLEHGANPNDGQGLYNSCFTGGTHWLELLIRFGLKQGDPVNWTDQESETSFDFLLAHAAKKNMLDRVELLLKHGADPNCVDIYEKKPCYEVALQAGNLEVLKLLEAHGGTPVDPGDEKQQFINACMAADQTRVEQMNDEFDADKIATWIKGTTGKLGEAADAGKLETVRFMIGLGFPIGQALFAASWRGELEIAKALIEYGASARERDPKHMVTPVAYADRAGHPEIVELLLEQNVDIFDAVRFGDASCIARVLANEPDSLEHLYRQYGNKVSDWAEFTPLALAVSLCRETIVTELIDRGADDSPKIEGQSLVDFARNSGFDRIAQILKN